jgi:predicted GNAT superfamily acetyltransferase
VSYVIREAHDADDFAQVSRVFQAVFDLEDAGTPPAWLLEDTVKAGGIMLGLWPAEGGDAIGFSYAFPGFKDGEPYLYSSGVGVLAEHRSRGQAAAMKLAQRERALELGYTRIVWTYSALRAVNAHLYVTRLGAIGTAYVLDNRGSQDTVWRTEGGVALDEFVVEWELESSRVRERVGGTAPAVDLAALPLLADGDVPNGSPRVAVEVPPDFQALVNHEPERAHDWRRRTRPLFARLLDDGYVLIECLHDADADRVHYVFERGAPA